MRPISLDGPYRRKSTARRLRAAIREFFRWLASPHP